MQKKVIALAIAGLVAAPAFAQSNVTVYGVADLYTVTTSGGGARVNALQSGGENGSRLGFKGSEALGNGMKAIFDFQFGSLGLDTDSGIARTRYSFVGLEGGFGKLIAGRIQTPGYYSSYYYDPGMAHFFSAYQFLGRGIAKGGVGASINTGWNGAARQNNTIEYQLPTFGGLTTKIDYGFGEQDGKTVGQQNRQSFYALGFDYANGPLMASYTYQRFDNINGTNADQGEHFIGAKYDFGAFALMGSWQNAKVSNSGNNGTDKLWNLGVRANVSPNMHVMAGYSKADVHGQDADGKGYTLGLYYGLSKRTHIYTGVSRVTNGGKTTQFNLRENLPISNGDSVSTFGIGLDHVF